MFYLSARGVYLCCKYLIGPTFYTNHNGITEESPGMGNYSYKKILDVLRGNFESKIIEGYEQYDGESVWKEFFLTDEYLVERIKVRRVNAIDEMHFRAKQKDNGG
jgi:hypothetical protein